MKKYYDMETDTLLTKLPSIIDTSLLMQKFKGKPLTLINGRWLTVETDDTDEEFTKKCKECKK